jgi:uncharacterized protein with GYD domain
VPTYIIGAKITDKAGRTDQQLAEIVDRVAQVRTGHGGRLLAGYVTFGRYDMIWISEYPDERAAFDAMTTNLDSGLIEVEISEALTVEEYLRDKRT